MKANSQTLDATFASEKLKAVTSVSTIFIGTLSVFLAFCFGAFCGFTYEKRPESAQQIVTQMDASQATTYLKRKFPNSPLRVSPADVQLAGLMEVQGGPAGADTWFDPTRRLLIIGLVVNPEMPSQVIAPGHLVGAHQK